MRRRRLPARSRRRCGARGARPRPLRRTRRPTSPPSGTRSASTSSATPAAFRDFFKAHYGPTIAVYRGIADDPARVAALDEELLDLARRFDHGADGRTVMEWEYLLVTARRA